MTVAPSRSSNSGSTTPVNAMSCAVGLAQNGRGLRGGGRLNVGEANADLKGVGLAQQVGRHLVEGLFDLGRRPLGGYGALDGPGESVLGLFIGTEEEERPPGRVFDIGPGFPHRI